MREMTQGDQMEFELTEGDKPVLVCRKGAYCYKQLRSSHGGYTGCSHGLEQHGCGHRMIWSPEGEIAVWDTKRQGW